jgi:hypothetical protein
MRCINSHGSWSIDRPRAILIEKHGILIGLLTVKDCLKYTLSHPHTSTSSPFASSSDDTYGGDENQKSGAMGVELEETLEEIMLWFSEVKTWVIDTVRGYESQNGRRRDRIDSLNSEVELGHEDEEEEEEEEEVDEEVQRGLLKREHEGSNSEGRRRRSSSEGRNRDRTRSR